MKTRSAKNKGKRLQNDVRDLILETFKELEPDDVRSTTMGDSGEDVLLSPAARKLFPFSVECKNQEKLNIWSSLQQAEDNAGQHIPLLVFKRNRSKTYITMEINDLIKILNDKKEYEMEMNYLIGIGKHRYNDNKFEIEAERWAQKEYRKRWKGDF